MTPIYTPLCRITTISSISPKSQFHNIYSPFLPTPFPSSLISDNPNKMGKKSIQNPKHEKKQPLNSLIKILRPKVYITDSSNFKKLVQELTGNGDCYPVESPPPPVAAPPLTWEDAVPFAYPQDSLDLSFESSCFATPLEGSPDFSVTENSVQKMDFYKDLEAMLMEMDSGTCEYDRACGYGMMLQEEQVCVYDYDLSTFI